MGPWCCIRAICCYPNKKVRNSGTLSIVHWIFTAENTCSTFADQWQFQFHIYLNNSYAGSARKSRKIADYIYHFTLFFFFFTRSRGFFYVSVHVGKPWLTHCNYCMVAWGLESISIQIPWAELRTKVDFGTHMAKDSLLPDLLFQLQTGTFCFIKSA